MKLFTFSLFVIAALFTLGCSTENPLCTDNFCVEGEIYAKSELAEGQAYGDLPINDAVIFATLAAGTTPVETTPVETAPADSVSLEAIVADVAAGGTTYVGETLTITAPVQFVHPFAAMRSPIALPRHAPRWLPLFLRFHVPSLHGRDAVLIPSPQYDPKANLYVSCHAFSLSFFL